MWQVPAQMWRVPAQMWAGSTRGAGRKGRCRPVRRREMCARRSGSPRVPTYMSCAAFPTRSQACTRAAEVDCPRRSRARPGAGLVAIRPVPAQMRAGVSPSPGADVGSSASRGEADADRRGAWRCAQGAPALRTRPRTPTASIGRTSYGSCSHGACARERGVWAVVHARPKRWHYSPMRCMARGRHAPADQVDESRRRAGACLLRRLSPKKRTAPSACSAAAAMRCVPTPKPLRRPRCRHRHNPVHARMRASAPRSIERVGGRMRPARTKST
jgi:hypothetical protein